MLPKVGVRSSALARAQAQLSGKRVPLKPNEATGDEEYPNALRKKEAALKSIPSSFDSLSDISTSEPPKAEERQSRFLKKPQRLAQEKPGDPNTSAIARNERSPPRHAHPTQPRKPKSAALMRLEEIENRHKLRKLQAEVSENDSDMWTSDERPFSARSSSSFSPRGKRFLKKIIHTTEQRAEIPEQDRHKETALGKQEGLVGSPLGKSADVDLLKETPQTPRSPSPPSKGYPPRRLRLSPPRHGSPESLDDLFVGTEDVSSTSSTDVRLNLLSLDELFPAADVDDGRKKTPRPPSPPSRGSPRRSARRSPLSASIAPSERLSGYGSPESPDEQIPAADDVSGASSAEFKLNVLSAGERDKGKNVQTEESDARNPRRSRELFRRKEPSSPEDSVSVALTEASGGRGKQPVRYERRATGMKGVPLIDAAVQTSESGLTCHQPGPLRAPGYAAMTYFNEPVSLADYTVSPELIEALSTNRSMAVALNDMLKQQLHLTRSFATVARQLYLSTVSSLEREVYHYTTLEETKEYIRQQASSRWKPHPEVKTHPAAQKVER